MRSAFATSIARIFNAGTYRAPFTAALLAVLVLGGCDSEALVLSSADRDDRAMAALGTDHEALVRADVRGLMAESDAVLAMLPADVAAMWNMRLQEITAATGVDLEQDVDVFWAALGDDYGSAVAFAEHDPDFLATALPNRMTIAGHDVYHAEDAEGMNVASWKKEAIIATSTEQAMRRALEAFESNSPAPPLPKELVRVRSADAWVYIRDFPQLLTTAPDAGNTYNQLFVLLRQLQSGAAGVVVNDGSFSFQFVGSPIETTTASDLVSVLRGVVALVKMQPEIPAELVPVLEGVEISERDDLVTLELTLSAEATAALIASMQE